jgi:hypothetical protein
MGAYVSAVKRWKRGTGAAAAEPGIGVYEGHSRLPALDFGYLAWHLGPEGGDPLASGFDVAIVHGHVIAEPCTVITK